ncbi:hypothetical protein FHL15_009058 [Xylaria flabelliformis]|uniref:Uncharacterized protein n=1 Tax=Xylaria flabelliformis TaxID=2512241 RepID=A0A553HQC1_9PEZI|nr:hypothetical protein FHL15_009058 [Xylaria flabelliformis]
MSPFRDEIDLITKAIQRILNYVNHSQQTICNRVNGAENESFECLKLIDEFAQICIEMKARSKQSIQNQDSQNLKFAKELKEKIEPRLSSMQNQYSEILELVTEFNQVMDTRYAQVLEQLTQIQSSESLECAKKFERMMGTLPEQVIEQLVQNHNSNILEVQKYCFNTLKFMEELKQDTVAKSSLFEQGIQRITIQVLKTQILWTRLNDLSLWTELNDLSQ